MGQSVVLAAPPEALFARYLDAQRHAAITGMAVAISSKPGKEDPDSTLILGFSRAGRNKGRIDLVHLDSPKADYQSVTEGWKAYDRRPWRAYLARTKH